MLECHKFFPSAPIIYGVNQCTAPSRLSEQRRRDGQLHREATNQRERKPQVSPVYPIDWHIQSGSAGPVQSTGALTNPPKAKDIRGLFWPRRPQSQARFCKHPEKPNVTRSPIQTGAPRFPGAKEEPLQMAFILRITHHPRAHSRTKDSRKKHVRDNHTANVHGKVFGTRARRVVDGVLKHRRQTGEHTPLSRGDAPREAPFTCSSETREKTQ